MKIAISGTHCTGKSTYVKDFLKKWTSYTTPATTYRDFIKYKDLPHSKNGTEDSQMAILEALVKESSQYTRKDNVIFDRCIVDNLAYSSWLFLNGKVSEKFLDQSRIMVRRALEDFDIIFFIPLTSVSPVDFVKDDLRDDDLIYRDEIDNIFKTFVQSYRQQDGRVFPTDDGPPVIEMFGNPEERIKLTELYVDVDGKPFGEDASLISDIYIP